jgi:hypothetical protein
MKQYMENRTKTRPNIDLELKPLNYRFNIKERLSKFSPVKVRNIKLAVQRDSQKSSSTVWRTINAQYKQPYRVDLEVLQAFSKTFYCSIEDLQNPPQ